VHQHVDFSVHRASQKRNRNVLPPPTKIERKIEALGGRTRTAHEFVETAAERLNVRARRDVGKEIQAERRPDGAPSEPLLGCVVAENAALAIEGDDAKGQRIEFINGKLKNAFVV
jgi:hypothetical protein